MTFRESPTDHLEEGPCVALDSVVVSHNRTKRASVSPAIVRLRSRRSDWRDRRSRRCAKAASSRSAESGETESANPNYKYWRFLTLLRAV